jgi:hypothetical protein
VPDDRIELLAEGPPGRPERGIGLLLALAGWAEQVVSSPELTGPDLLPVGQAVTSSDGRRSTAAPADPAELTERNPTAEIDLDKVRSGAPARRRQWWGERRFKR